MIGVPPPLFDYGSTVRWYVDGNARIGSIVGFRGEPPEVAEIEMGDGGMAEVAIARLELIDDR